MLRKDKFQFIRIFSYARERRKFAGFFLLLMFPLIIFADPPSWQPISGTQYSMIAMVEIKLYDNVFEGGENNVAGAFGPGGESDCRGIGSWIAPNPPAHNGFWYFTIVGNKNGEEITFKIYDAGTDVVYRCNPTLTFVDNSTVGDPDFLELSVQESAISGKVKLVTTTPPAGNIVNVAISVGDVTVNPDANGEYHLAVSPGIYDVTSSLDGYTTITLKNILVEQNTVTENINMTLIDWEPIRGNQYNMVVVAQAKINGKIVSGGNNNQLAAFGPAGDEDCRGIGNWIEPTPPYEGYWYFTIRGKENGEEIGFKIYLEELDAIETIVQTISFKNDTTIGSPAEPLELRNRAKQELSLQKDWNWVSFNIHSDNPLVDSVFSSLTGSIFQIKSQNKSATYYHAQNKWVGDLTQIEDGKAYLINMYQAVEHFSVSGTPINASTPIALASGWNWIAYYPQNSIAVNSALRSIVPGAFQVKSQTQSATYFDPPGFWVGDLSLMEPGQGYKLKVTSASTLIYPESLMAKYLSKRMDIANSPDWHQISGTQYNMVLMASVKLDNEKFENTNGNKVGAFGPGGESDCRSVALWQKLSEDQDGFWYFTIVGNEQNEDISFKLYDGKNDRVVNCNQTIKFINDNTTGSPTEPFIITANTSDLINPRVQTKFKLNQNYPNPFNSSTRIKFSLEKESNVNITIYNLTGQKVRTLVDAKLNLGEYQIAWDGRDDWGMPVSSGIYLYRMKTDNYSELRKMILSK
ncbi:MAG TPA: T9SS type A sorting domain-containing protein [Candidatus Marinimicrobia bacterium]|nr:T9SS type A sorting domain-containing protein [Candidatus Neomarinimicrobiota bacterium]HRS51749.1 T9SS type A sorting domain-containing protein [Candidatus Neomarinimicrobiota bacterium]HRU93024.1 T9SS type A sorting domain-containing protein [Candidatus Neomarinimicrobiota bacterium]